MSKKKYKHYKIIPWITLILITLAFLMLMNFHYYVYLLNEDNYVVTKCKVTKEGFDGLTAFFPKIYVTYEYEGKTEESSIVLLDSVFFPIDTKINAIMVNKKSPKNLLVIYNFWDSIFNKLMVGLICIYLGFLLFSLEVNFSNGIQKQKDRVKRKRERVK